MRVCEAAKIHSPFAVTFDPVTFESKQDALFLHGALRHSFTSCWHSVPCEPQPTAIAPKNEITNWQQSCHGHDEQEGEWRLTL